MKVISLFLAAYLLFTGIASAWNPSSLTKNLLQSVVPSGKSSTCQIPQFILDTDHPWLATNKAWLSHYPNVTRAICSRDSTLWTSPISPDHALPTDLFQHLLIDNNRVSKGRLGWSNVRNKLQEMGACDAALTGVQHLHVDVYVHDNKDLGRLEPTLPPIGVPELFADVLARMSNLERLDWGISSEAAPAFEPAFVVKGLMMPSVKYLQPGAGSDYLVSRCPNVEVLEAGDYFHHWSWGRHGDHRSNLIKASTGLNNLREWRLGAGWEGWTIGMLEGILDATPNITTLRMDGPLKVPDDIRTARRIEKYSYFGDRRGLTLKRYLQALDLFPNLENLYLPASRDLDLGFDGGPWCGNAYDGPQGRAYGRLVVQEDAETTELAANIAMSELPRLKNIGIGLESANLTLNDRGQADMMWPWTGRMEQYTYEIWEE